MGFLSRVLLSWFAIMSGTKQPKASAYLQSQESENDRLSQNRHCAGVLSACWSKTGSDLHKNIHAAREEEDFLFFFTAKSGISQSSKRGCMVESVKMLV